MKYFLSVAFFFVASAFPVLAEDSETPATPKYRTAPDYPASCQPASGLEVEPHRVVVRFNVAKNGQTENVKAAESTDSCFEEAAIAAVRSWSYKPRRVDGHAQSQAGLEVTISFVWSDETALKKEVNEAPIRRTPPHYPERCLGNARNSESVTVIFDVTKKGRTENIRIANSTNKCFNKAAARSVARWRYREKFVDGELVVRNGIETVVTFELSNSFPPELVIRRAVKKKLNEAKRALIKAKEPDKAIVVLQELEREYGDTFSHIELVSFHQVRATMRLEIEDYSGALDDFRIVKKTGIAARASEAIDQVISDLETALAAQEAAVASQKDSSSSDGKPDAQ